MKAQNEIQIEEASKEAVVTIRCLSSIPEELETLLAEIAEQEEEMLG